uniref:uncharacterized protein LOC120332960 n=1 Tax=Styela clava TaxID=7725 RepID=UPI001939F4C8|nr:uncharacterized protein LOC120332960 [Styela clava]
MQGPTKYKSGEGKCEHRCFVDNRKKYSTRCDGINECENFFDEECINCPPQQFCNYFDFSLYSYKCPSSRTKLPGIKICDGKPDCENGEEEIGCRLRFYCNGSSPINIEKNKVCNLLRDCEDSSDEMDCDNKTHFYCNDEGTTKFIPTAALCDGSQNCQSGKDECLDECIQSSFSDVHSLIKNNIFFVIICITSIGTLVGNLIVIITAAKDFKKKHLFKNVLINKLLICNLSISDLIVGIYTSAICIKGLAMRGNYCKEDSEWRSGNTCSILGFLLLAGSESSVFSLTILTGFRAYSIMRPFAEVRLSFIRRMIALSWILAVGLAAVPLLPATDDYFVDSVWIEDNPLFATINKNELEEINKWLSLTQNRTDDLPLNSWSTLDIMLKRLHPDFSIGRKFGYYSTHTVCLPTLFPKRTVDVSWVYSTIVLVVNCSLFFLIMIGCILIYLNSTKKSLAVDNEVSQIRSEKMRIKISLIITTDFLCWVPICIMGFLQLAGIDMPSDAYLPVGLLVIPINSFMNPILYNVPMNTWKRLLVCRKKK